jgi:hypothetical protein
MVSVRLVACAFLGLSGCATIVPGPSGAHGIGTTHFELSEPGYLDPYAPAPTPRRIPLQAPEAHYRLAAPFCFLYADTTKVGGVAVTNGAMNDALLAEAPAGSCGASLRGASHRFSFRN